MTTPRALSFRREGLRRTSGAVSSVAALLSLVFLPKCPLCVAAYLAGLGLGTGAAAFAAPLVRPLALVLTVVAAAALLRGAWRHRGYAKRAPPCPPTSCCG